MKQPAIRRAALVTLAAPPILGFLWVIMGSGTAALFALYGGTGLALRGIILVLHGVTGVLFPGYIAVFERKRPGLWLAGLVFFDFAASCYVLFCVVLPYPPRPLSRRLFGCSL